MGKKKKSSLSARAVTYCRENRESFSRQLNYEGYDFLVYRFYIISGAIVLASVANASLAGIYSLQVMMLPFLLSVIPKIINYFSDRIILPISRWYLVLLSGVTILSLGYLYFYIDKIGNSPADLPPIQITLGIFLSFTVYFSGILSIFLVNLFLTILLVGFYLGVNPSYVHKGFHLFVGGFAVGTFLSILFNRFKMISFYTIGIEKKLTLHLLKELESMAYPHQTKMLETHFSLSETMLLKKTEACLGEFDIIDSSQIKEVNTYHDINSRIFKECYRKILLNYRMNPSEPNRPFSDGHVVKEMGDGFIYSVGFPFKVPGPGQKDVDIAFELARYFIKVFDEEIRKDKDGFDCFCVVVLIRSELEAFWTNYQVRHYDFKQHCVTKLFRFQEMRRHLARVDVYRPQASFILMEDEFYHKLSPELKKGAHNIDLEDQGVSVRDCPGAKQVYLYQVDNASGGIGTNQAS